MKREGSNTGIVVTGMGAICCLGRNVAQVWEGLCQGKSGISRITKFDPTGLRNEEAGEVKDFAPPEDWRHLDEATQFALTASAEAIQDSGLDLDACDHTRAGVICSTNFGGGGSWDRMIRQADDGLDANLFYQFSFHSALDEIATRFGLLGPKSLISNSCSSGANAIGYAFDLIRSGRADIMLAGGHDSLALSSLAGLSALRTITAEKIRPFDKNRSGTIFSEGAGMLLLEDFQHAQQRGATIYAQVLGYGVNNNAYHLTAPDKGGAGLAQVLQMALADAQISPDQLDYINAHGTGTKYHDPAETQAIKSVLGDHAYRIPVSSIKAATGHVMAGAGAVEAIASILAMRDSMVPPTLNYQEPDPECDLDYVPNQARKAEVSICASISSGIGGNNAALILGKVHLARPERGRRERSRKVK